VEPGETLTIDLLIDPVKPYQTQQRTFKVTSKSIELEDAPVVTEETSLQIVGVPWFRRLVPFLLLFGAAVGISSVVFWLMNTGALG
jgi:hypothetical protein